MSLITAILNNYSHTMIVQCLSVNHLSVNTTCLITGHSNAPNLLKFHHNFIQVAMTHPAMNTRLVAVVTWPRLNFIPWLNNASRCILAWNIFHLEWPVLSLLPISAVTHVTTCICPSLACCSLDVLVFWTGQKSSNHLHLCSLSFAFPFNVKFSHLLRISSEKLTIDRFLSD